MSGIKKLKFGIFLLVAIFSCFLFGCEKTTPVNDIYFSLPEGDQIIMIVGETFEIGDCVEIKPSYASNQNFAITSFNEDVIKVVGNKIVAMSEGEARVKVSADDNEIKQDVMTVVVRKTKASLATPRNLIYNADTQLFTFDMVPYAVGYTFKVNGVEYELGNSNIFSMAQNNINIVNEIIYAQVKANAPTYTNALFDSSYTDEYKIYQAGGVENLQVKNSVLSFNKTQNTLKANVYINNQLFVENSNLSSFSLCNLDEIYANSNIEIAVETVVDENVKAGHPENVNYFNSIKQRVGVNVLDVPIVTINQTTLSWQNISYCKGYSIVIDGDEKAQTQKNYFNLESLNDFYQIITAETVSIVQVIPIINDETYFVASTSKINETKISRLPSTVVTCDNNGLIWSKVNRASAYSFTLTSDDINLASSTTLNTYSFVGGTAGSYQFKIQAVGGFSQQGVYYLSSKITTKVFTKQPKVTAEIDDYVLKISNLDTLDCKVDFDKANYDVTLEGNGSVVELDLSQYVFDAGEHSISLTRCGDSNSIPSDPITVSFVQFEAVSSIVIVDGKAQVQRSEINKDANICLSIQNQSTKEIIEQYVENEEYEFNTIGGEGYLTAGNYTVSVYVQGEGGSTFSYKENGVDKVCATVDFSVLSAPIATLKSTNDSTIVYNKVYNAESFDIFLGEEKTFVENTESVEFDFELNSGSICYSVRAKGDGTKYLHSAYSEEVNITRLEMPTLKYNNATEVFTKQDINNSDLVVGFEFMVDGEVEEYDFGTAKHFNKDSVVSLTTLAVTEKDGILYLNSLPCVLNLIKISNVATLEMDNNSNLKIIPEGHSDEYELEIVFGFTNKTDTYKSNNGVLFNENEDVLEYSYNDGVYLVEITENHQALIKDMIEEFTVKVKFIEPSTGDDLLINSEYTNEITMELARISNTTVFEVNQNNQLVLTPNDHTQQYGITLVINESEDLTFVDSGSKLISNSCQLSYTYNSETGSYIVDLFDDKYDPINDVFGSTFTVKVKYTHNFNTSSTDLDSTYSSVKTITVLPASILTRGEQNIQISNVKENYDFNNYALLVNNQYLLPLTEEETAKGDGYLTVAVDYIYANTPVAYLQATNAINVITLNINSSSETPELSKKSDRILIARTESVVLSSSKDNSTSNNSVIINLNAYTTDYDKNYVVSVYAADGQIIVTKRFVDTEAKEGVISFELDDISNLTNNFTISALVNTTAKNNSFEMFNSVVSNVLEFQQVEKVSNLKISHSILTFNAVDNADGYEVYQKTGTEYIKLNKDLITTNEFEITSLSTNAELVVKAISASNGYTNSYYSEPISVKVMSALKVEVVDGKFNVSLPTEIVELILDANTLVTSEIVNKQGETSVIDFDQLGEGITLDLFNLTLTISPALILCYNSESVLPEELSFRIKVAYIDSADSYYLNSNLVELTVHGLIAPTEVKKTTNENTNVEQIIWTPSEKNILNGEDLEVGYIFAVEYTVDETTERYYSNDAELKYYDEETKTYKVYDKFLTETRAIFPAGCDTDGDGTLDVEFGAGRYKLLVQAVPISTIEGYNLCSSLFTAASEFEILEQLTPTVTDGKVTWDVEDSANRFKVEVFEDGGVEPIATDYVTTNEYTFTNTKFKGYSGVLKVVVTAESTRTDILASKASAPIYIYRLPEAKSVNVEDGQLIIEANKFFTTAKIEFIDKTTGKVYIQTYSNATAGYQLSGLSRDSWQGFTDDDTIAECEKFDLGLDTSVLNILYGRDYTINVTLIGNSDEKLGMISSSTNVNISSLTVTKMNPNLTEVSLGVLQFTPNENYATIVETETKVTYTPIVDINYIFNGQEATAFWHNTAIYKIQIIHSRSLTTIYAVDYYSFISAINNGIIDEDEYELIQKENGLYAIVKYAVSSTQFVYFNVYLNNKLNLRDYDEISYYQVQETMNNGINTLSGLYQEKTISLAEGGSFSISLTMMGGDSYAVGETSVGYLNAGVSLSKTFIRYGTNILSSIDGKLAFEDLKEKIGDAVLDNPIYKVVVTPINTTENMIFYLYHTTEADAKTVAKNHDPENYETATYLQVEIDEDYEGVLLFDLSSYINAGTYKINIRTLAGLGTGLMDDADYLLNAKEPTTSYTFYKLSTTEFVGKNGVLEFAQSYILKDSEYIYYDNYEITLYSEELNKSFVYDINRSTEGVVFDDLNHTIQYTVPSSLIFDEELVLIEAGKNYQIQIKAKGTENFILSGTYVDDMLNIVKAYGLSEELDEKLRVENGILKWNIDQYSSAVSTVIKVAFLDANSELTTIYINVSDMNKAVDEEGNYLYHYYEFKDEKYNGIYLTNDIEYTISAYVVGNNTTLNSNYSSEIKAFRLKTIDADSIKTIDGILTWEEILDAQYYEVSIDDNTYTSSANFMDVSLLNLAVDSYSVNVRAIGASHINGARLLTAVTGFVQLGVVDLSSIQVSGESVVWDKVDNALGYKIIFNYTDLDGNAQVIDKVVTTNEFTIESIGILGKFTMSIVAVGIGESKIFNGKAIEYTSSYDVPTQVDSIAFDSENNRIVIEVNNDSFLSSDSLLIVYNIEVYSSQTTTQPAKRETITLTYQQANRYEVVDDFTTRYYLPLTIMAKYSNIYVQVNRPNTLASNRTTLDDIDLHLFSCGEGTEENPYQIQSREQLLNISYFTSANYILTSAIDLTGTDISERLLEHNAVISSEFNGVFDGNNYAILGFNIDEDSVTDTINLEQVSNFALFGTLNNATIKNLIIGTPNIQLILSNMFATSASNMVKLSLIATGANNSTIDNITILDVKVEFKQEDTITKVAGGLDIAGMFIEATNTNISNSTINLEVNIAGAIANDVAIRVGGVAVEATTSNVSASEISLTISSKTSNLLTRVGGVFAHYIGNTSKTTGITETTANVEASNVQMLYFGGLVGFARNILIDSSETTGTYSKANISSTAYIGGLVGHAQSSTIKNSGSFIELNLSVSNTTSKYFGAIVGMMSIYQGVAGEIQNCYSHIYIDGQEETSISTEEVVIGMYGSATGVDIEGNYKKEQ